MYLTDSSVFVSSFHIHLLLSVEGWCWYKNNVIYIDHAQFYITTDSCFLQYMELYVYSNDLKRAQYNRDRTLTSHSAHCQLDVSGVSIKSEVILMQDKGDRGSHCQCFLFWQSVPIIKCAIVS